MVIRPGCDIVQLYIYYVQNKKTIYIDEFRFPNKVAHGNCSFEIKAGELPFIKWGEKEVLVQPKIYMN